jgi:hypothetical protein
MPYAIRGFCPRLPVGNGPAVPLGKDADEGQSAPWYDRSSESDPRRSAPPQKDADFGANRRSVTDGTQQERSDVNFQARFAGPSLSRACYPRRQCPSRSVGAVPKKALEAPEPGWAPVAATRELGSLVFRPSLRSCHRSSPTTAQPIKPRTMRTKPALKTLPLRLIFAVLRSIDAVMSTSIWRPLGIELRLCPINHHFDDLFRIAHVAKSPAVSPIARFSWRCHRRHCERVEAALGWRKIGGRQTPFVGSLPGLRTGLRRPNGRTQQGRRDLNPQPPVLETGALPIELRPWVAEDCTGAFRASRSA